MTRKIECDKCHKHLGEIRDATLRKGIVFICAECKSENNIYSGIKDIGDMLKGFGKK